MAPALDPECHRGAEAIERAVAALGDQLRTGGEPAREARAQMRLLQQLTHLGSRLARGLAARSELVAQRCDRTLDRLGAAMALRIERWRHQLSAVSGQLDVLSPLKTLERGYAVARDAEGRVLKRVAQFAPGLSFRLRVVDGDVPARVGES